MKRKPYNILDQRKTDFDDDYDDFNRTIDDLHNQITLFMETNFSKINSTLRSVNLLKKFER